MTAVDITRNWTWSTPHFDSRQQEEEHCYKRFVTLMTEEEMPPLPTREEELAYLDFLEKSISTDPIITLRPKRYMAGPHRLRWKAMTEIRNEYRKTFLKNFLVSTVLVLARKRQHMPFTGVPKYIKKRDIFTPEYRMVSRHLNHTTTRTFYYGFFKYTVFLSLGLAFLFTDRDYMRDDLHNRPDLKEMRIMVREDYIPIKEKKALEMMSGSYFGRPLDNEQPTGLWKRFLRKVYGYTDYTASPVYCAPPFNYRKDYQSEDWSNHYHM